MSFSSFSSFRSFVYMVTCALLVLVVITTASAQAQRGGTKPATKTSVAATVGPKITVIDIEGLRKLIKPGSKPLMINFWATWCDPCRDEFPDLVKINQQYKGKIDFVTVSLDDLSDVDRDVPKFLAQMKADMPAYLLHTPDDDAAINLISPEWAGNLPLTIIYKPGGEIVYMRKGAIHIDDVTMAIDKLLSSSATGQ